MTATVNPAESTNLKFKYLDVIVKDLKAHITRRATDNKPIVHAIEVDGQRFKPTQRFWTSLQARFGFSSNIFKYFDHHEVFDRISERAKSDELRFAVELGEPTAALGDVVSNMVESDNVPYSGTALAVTNPNAVAVAFDEHMGLLSKYGFKPETIVTDQILRARQGTRIAPSLPASLRPAGVGARDILTSSSGDGGPRSKEGIPLLSYNQGIVRSIHTPARNNHPYLIAGDIFHNQFVIDTPIDGFGKPSIYLMLLREICTNGAIGYSAAFKAEISLGKKEDSFDYALMRAIEGYNNEDGFAALRERFEVATKSWASINEINRIYKTLVRLHHNGHILKGEKYAGDDTGVVEGSPIIISFNRMVGDLTKVYGLANLDALGIKRQRTLPTGAKMYDLLNFISEVATHRTTPQGSQIMQAEIGNLVAAEYDLQGTAEAFEDWKDFLITDDAASSSLQAAKAK